MSQIITIEGGIYFDTREFSSEQRFTFFRGECESWDCYLAVVPHTISVMAPSGWDPRPATILALEAKREKLRAEFAASVEAINVQISKLTAIGYEAEAA